MVHNKIGMSDVSREYFLFFFFEVSVKRILFFFKLEIVVKRILSTFFYCNGHAAITKFNIQRRSPPQESPTENRIGFNIYLSLINLITHQKPPQRHQAAKEKEMGNETHLPWTRKRYGQNKNNPLHHWV